MQHMIIWHSHLEQNLTICFMSFIHLRDVYYQKHSYIYFNLQYLNYILLFCCILQKLDNQMIWDK